MIYYSPLRYPGGKNKLAKFIALVCVNNNINGHYIEPYAGGAAVALDLLINGYVREITINDFDRSIFAFWHGILNETDRFCDQILKKRVTIAEWKRNKEVQNNKNTADIFDLGFSTFYLNRTNRSGMLNGGPIGGFEQDGKYRIDCRYNKTELVARAQLIASYKSRIRLLQMDAIDLINKVQKEAITCNDIFYFDPPYYLQGESLYYNAYKHDDHVDVSNAISKINNAHWLVSYDNNNEVRKMYKPHMIKSYSVRHTARVSHKGKEILVSSPKLVMPWSVLQKMATS